MKTRTNIRKLYWIGIVLASLSIHIDVASATVFRYSYNLIFQNTSGIPATDFHLGITWQGPITITIPLVGPGNIDEENFLQDVTEFNANNQRIGTVFDNSNASASFTGGQGSVMPALTIDFFADKSNPVVNPMNQILVAFEFDASSNQGVLTEHYWTNSGLIDPTNPNGRIAGTPAILSLNGGISIRKIPEPVTMSLIIPGLLCLAACRRRKTLKA